MGRHQPWSVGFADLYLMGLVTPGHFIAAGRMSSKPNMSLIADKLKNAGRGYENLGQILDPGYIPLIAELATLKRSTCEWKAIRMRTVS